MIGLDTNVLVRYLVKDDPRQADKASSYIQAQSRRNDGLFLNHIVLCELIWVLESAYGYSKQVILDVLEKILITKQFRIERKDDVWAACAEFRAGQADFSDYLLGRANHSYGCEHTVTFDKSLKGSKGYRLL